MAEYIERESMIKHLDILYDRMYAKSPQFYNGFMIARNFVNEFTAADVAPVVHGTWQLRHEGMGHYWECSVCHTNPCIYVTNETRFCPNCGARMDEEAEDEP